MTATPADIAFDIPAKRAPVVEYFARNPTVLFGVSVLLIMSIISIAAPWLTEDPLRINPISTLR